MKNYLFIFFVLSFISGQHGHDHDHDHHHGSHNHSHNAIISGQVISIDSGTPIEGANVSLINTKSQKIEAFTTTLSNGGFNLIDIHSGAYVIAIDFIGFKPWTSETIIITAQNQRKDIGVIKLSIQSIQSEDVLIQEDKEAYQFGADKIIYTPEQDIIASAGSAEDVLAQAPLVSVDQDGEVSLRGNSNVNILVDGRPKRIDLASIPASQIKEVEVITSPSAKYDPEGMAGIINIVLSKGTKDGFNGDLKLNARHNKHYSLDKMNGLNFNGNYRKQKLNLFSSLSINNKFSNRSGHRRTITTLTSTLQDADDTIDSLFYDYTENKERLFYNLKIGADYYINDFVTISSQLKADHHAKKSNTIQEFFAPDSLAGLQEESIEQDDSEDPNLDLEYLFVFDREYINPDKAFSFSVNFHKGDDAEQAIEGNKLTKFSAIHSAIDLDFLYKLPLDEKSKIEFGYDGRIIDNSNKMSFLESVLFTDEDNINFDNLNTEINNEFLFKRNLHGFFIEYEDKLSNSFSIKPSLRIEKVDRNVEFETDFPLSQNIPTSIYDDLLINAANQSYDLDTLELYPYLNMTYNIGENENI